MNRTKELLLKMKEAVSDGRMSVEAVPIADIKECVYSEIMANRCTFTERQYTDVLDRLDELCINISEKEWDKEKIFLFIDALILCVDMISQSIYSLANGEYWRFKHQKELHNSEVAEIIDYIDKEKKISLISYGFVQEYDSMPVEVLLDKSSGLRYVLYKEKPMFFPRNWDEDEILEYYRGVVMEQDERSPHSYRDDACRVYPGDIVVDAGTAEGIFALDVIDIAEKIYLIEPDPEWVEALEQTFKDCRDRVHIVSCFLSRDNQGKNVSLDFLFKSEDVNFIKMDIEGYEKMALLGGEGLLDRCGNLRCAICVYHCREDESWVSDFLKRHGFQVGTSKGYMCPDWTIEAYLEAELRRGVVFGIKGVLP